MICLRPAAVLLFFLVLPVSARAHPMLDARLAAVDERLSEDPDDASLLLRRGNLQRERRRWAAALADYNRAARLRPEMDEIDLARGRLLNDAGRPGEALPFLDRFLARKAGDAGALLARAWSLGRLGRHAEAARDLRRAIALMRAPRPDHYLSCASNLAAAGNESEALAALDEALARFGNVAALQRAAIDIEVKRGRYEAALGRLDRVPRNGAPSARWLLRRAEILERAGRPAEAIAAVREAQSALRSAPPAARRVAAVEQIERDLESAGERLEPAP